jgi:hypothetical protein
LVVVHFEESPNVKSPVMRLPKPFLLLQVFNNIICIIRIEVPMLDGTSNGASYYGLFTMFLLLHLTKCPTPT